MILRCKLHDTAITVPRVHVADAQIIVEVIAGPFVSAFEIVTAPDGSLWPHANEHLGASWLIASLGRNFANCKEGHGRYALFADSALRPLRHTEEPDETLRLVAI